jgi:hypothetical protein
MASLTQKTERRRQLRLRRAGRKATKARMRAASPEFPVHPAGYDPKAPDAKSQASSGE